MDRRVDVRVTAQLAAVAPDLEKGVRAAVVMLVPYYLAASWGRPELAWTALGGWLGTLADPGGQRSTRARALVAFALVGAVLVALSEALAPTGWLATAGLGVMVLVLALLRAAGGAAGSVGALLALVAAVASGRVRTTPLEDAAAFAVGGLAAVFFSSVVWPVWTHLPVRRAVGFVYRELAAYATAVRDAVAEGAPQGAERWNVLVREHHLRVRKAIEAARAVALEVRTRRVGETRLGGNVRALLGEAEAEFPLLSSFVQELEALAPELREEPARCLVRIASDAREVEEILVTPLIREREPRLHTRAGTTRGEAVSAARALAARLAAVSGAAVDLARGLDAEPRDGTQAGGRPRPRTGTHATIGPEATPGALVTGVRALVDTLSPRSPYLRHAVRAAGAALGGSFIGHALSPQHVHWVTLAAMVILQPEAGATVKRASERVIGTVLGCLLAVIITTTVHDPVALSLLLVPLSIAAIATRTRSYRLFTFFLTPVFVLLAERHPGDWWTAAERAGDAVLGGIVALVAGVLVFPSSERTRLPDALAGAMETARRYAAQVLAAAREPEQVADARREAGLAISAAEASLERYLAEPRRHQGPAADAMLLVTYLRRLVAAMTSVDTLSADSRLPRPSADRAAVAAYLDQVLVSAQEFVRGEPRSHAVASPLTLADDAPESPADAEITPVDAALERAVHWGSLVASAIEYERPLSVA